MIINLIYANSAPASFKVAMQQAAAILDAAITDPIAVNIEVGYGVWPGPGGGTITNGSAEAAPNPNNYGSLPYSQVVGKLVANAAPGDPNFTWLSNQTSISANTDTISAGTEVIVWSAEEKALGIIPADASGIDGFAGFATDIPTNALVGVALHELTHAMGRVPSGPPDQSPWSPQPDIFDLFRFTSQGNVLVSDNIPEVAAYFSVNGGVTDLANYGQQSDPSDFLNDSKTGKDSFAEFYTPGSTDQFLTPVNLTLLDALGFNTDGLTWASGQSGDFGVTSNWSPTSSPGPNSNVQILNSGTYTVSSSENETINILTMAAGAMLDIISGIFTIDNGTDFTPTSGTIEVDSGATLVLDGMFTNAGTIRVLGGTIDLSGTISGTGTDVIESGGALFVSSGAVVTSATILSGGTEGVGASGLDRGAKVIGGTQTVSSGGSAFSVVVSNGGDEIILSGAVASGAIISNGGSAVVSLGGLTSGTIVLSGGTLFVGGVARTTKVFKGGVEVISVGGTDSGGQISGGEQDVGGFASATGVKSGGTLLVEAGGSATGATVSSGGLEMIVAGGVATGVVSSGGALEWVGSGQVTLGPTVSSGAILEFASGYVGGGNVVPSYLVKVLAGGTQSGGAILSGGVLDIFSDGIASGVTVSNGGKSVVFSGGADIAATVRTGGTAVVSSGGTDLGVTLSSGAKEFVLLGGTALGTVVSSGGALVVSSGGLADPARILAGGNETIRAGGTDDGAQISGGVQSIFGLDSGGTVFAGSAVVQSGGVARGLVVSGGKEVIGAHGVDSGAQLSGGTQLLQPGGTASGTIVSSGGTEIVSSGASAVNTEIESGGKEIILPGGIGSVLSGAIISDSGALFNSATIIVSAGGSLALAGSVTSNRGSINVAGATNGSGGTLIVSGTVLNSGGTLFASGSGSLIEITGGAVVSGGVVKVGNGVVDIQSGGTANVTFLSTGVGGLEIEDSQLAPNAFTGTVTGFGGVSHANHTQYIDLASVSASDLSQIHLNYTQSGTASGTLTVSSGATVVASIKLIGTYSAANFSATLRPDSSVAIVDPVVTSGGIVESGAASVIGGHAIGQSWQIGFDAHATLADSETGNDGMILTADNGGRAAALLGHYMAASFASAGNGGTLTVDPMQTATQEVLLTHPHP